MTTSNYQVRRATIDDLAALRKLWHQRQLQGRDLEKHLTDFQVVETADGEVLGALGLQVQRQHGRIHTEVYRQPEWAPELRPRLWERVQAIARNRGLTWLWVANQDSMFWLESGFEAAGPETLQNLPPEFQGDGEQWLARKLREETADTLALEQELAIFRQAQLAESDRVTRKVQLLRVLAGLVVLMVLALVACAGWYVLRHMHPGSGQ